MGSEGSVSLGDGDEEEEGGIAGGRTARVKLQERGRRAVSLGQRQDSSTGLEASHRARVQAGHLWTMYSPQSYTVKTF